MDQLNYLALEAKRRTDQYTDKVEHTAPKRTVKLARLGEPLKQANDVARQPAKLLPQQLSQQWRRTPAIKPEPPAHR